MRVVITGAPFSGKTTIVKLLSQIGFQTVPEAAEIVLRREKWENELDLQTKIYKLQLRLEESVDGHLVFLDRGLPDGIAYLEKKGETLPELVEASKNRYDYVFVPERLKFRPGGIRRESSDEEARQIEDRIISVYKRLGYNPVRVPLSDPKTRVRFILSKIGIYPHRL